MKDPRLGRYRRWILVNVLGVGAGLALPGLGLFEGSLDDRFLRMVRTFTVFALGGLVIGVCQVLGLIEVLGQRVTWAARTALGLGVSAVVAWDIVGSPDGIIAFGVMAGLTLGCIQMSLSRSWLKNPSNWLGWTFLAWAIGYPLANHAVTTFYLSYIVPHLRYAGAQRVPAAMALMSGLVVGLIVGVLSGLPLLYSSATRQAKDDEQAPTSSSRVS